MPTKTEKNLVYAFAAESKAAARNAAFALKAELDGYPQIAHLFRAVSEAESVHARRYLNFIRGKIGSTEENLEAAFQNEIKANADEYPSLIKDAFDEGRKSVEEAFSQARDVETRHAELYKKAMDDMLGFFLIRNDEILCEAIAGAVVMGTREIGVDTSELHRQRGYATLTCAKLIQTCEAQGLQTYWNCNQENLASVALARKLGYQTERGYKLLMWEKDA